MAALRKFEVISTGIIRNNEPVPVGTVLEMTGHGAAPYLRFGHLKEVSEAPKVKKRGRPKKEAPATELLSPEPPTMEV